MHLFKTAGLLVLSAILGLALWSHSATATPKAAKPKKPARIIKVVRQPRPPLKPHFSGVGTWVYTTVPSHKNRRCCGLAEELKGDGYSFAVIAAWNGSVWGLPKRGDQCCEDLVAAMHRNGIRAYAYSTAYFRGGKEWKKKAEANVNNAIRAMHERGADGVMFDDVFSGRNGRHAGQAKYVFETLGQHLAKCKRCKNGQKVMAFSAYYDHLSNREWPWQYPIRHCRFFLPQSYILTENQGRKQGEKLTPLGISGVAQSNLDRLIGWKRLETKPHSRLVPGIEGYDSVPTRQMDDFLAMGHGSYRGVMVFRHGLVGRDNQKLLTLWAKKYAQKRKLHYPSAMKDLAQSRERRR